MKKWFLIRGLAIAVIVAIAFVASFFTIMPGRIERALNRIVPVPLEVTQAAATACDARGRRPACRQPALEARPVAAIRRGHVDLPRLIEGRYALQVFSSVTKSPQGQNYDANRSDSDTITSLAIVQLQPPRTWDSLLERSLWHAKKLRGFAQRSGGAAQLIDQRRTSTICSPNGEKGYSIVGAMLSIEGLQDIEGKLGNLDVLYAAGFRMAGLRISSTMRWRDRCTDRQGRADALGRDVVSRMEALGMIVDLAHASHATIADVLAMAKRPVVSSHGGVQATCKVNRNLTDDEIKGIARTGGLIGIGFWGGAICSTRPGRRHAPSPMSAISSASIMSGLARTSMANDGRF